MVRVWLLSAVLLATSGCLDVCARAALLNTGFQERHAACYPADTLPSAPFDEAQCDSAMTPCTPADEAALQRYFDCLEALPVCTPETRGAFRDAMLQCANGMQQLSAGCFRP